MSHDLSPQALLERSMPEGAAARADAARHTLSALLAEQHRLSRLGFEFPLARCHEQIRYWGFVTRLLSLPVMGEERTGGFRWPSDPR